MLCPHNFCHRAQKSANKSTSGWDFSKFKWQTLNILGTNLHINMMVIKPYKRSF